MIIGLQIELPTESILLTPVVSPNGSLEGTIFIRQALHSKESSGKGLLSTFLAFARESSSKIASELVGTTFRMAEIRTGQVV